MFVKICGITNEEDALMAVALGADALGFVLAPSARQVTLGTVRDIVRRLPPDVVTIGVFRDQAPQTVIDTVLEAGLSGAQLHGHETPEDAAKVRPYCQVLFAAFAADDPGLAHAEAYGADAVLVDSKVPGSGEVFDWSLVEQFPQVPKLVLAGGLGNMVDRVSVGAVRDFLHLFPRRELPFGLHWPGGSNEWFPWVFNVADMELIAGMALLMIAIQLSERRAKAAARSSPATPA